MQRMVLAVTLPEDPAGPDLELVVDAVMIAAAANQVSEPHVLYCEIARCASCGTNHTSPTTGVMFDRCGCGGYLFAIAGAWHPAVGADSIQAEALS